MTQTIVILDPPGSDLRRLVQTFKTAVDGGCTIELIPDAPSLVARLDAARPCDLVVVDHDTGDGKRRGLEIVSEIRTVDEDVPVVVVARHGNVRTASRAVQAGATDLLVRGERLAERVATLLAKVARLSHLLDRNRALLTERQARLDAEQVRHRIVGSSPRTLELLETVDRVARTPQPLLIAGERGTGKELVARAIHTAGSPDGPFVKVNCAAFSDPLLERELFGHETGPGAERAAEGCFARARAGTLFLDEIGNTSTAFRQKVLRVTESGRFMRVGGRAELSTDARVVVATSLDPRARVEHGTFLSDLHDQLSFETIRVSPLRDRSADIEPLAQHFLSLLTKEIPHLRGTTLAPSTLELLTQHDFPGNVRELENIIERAASRDVSSEIEPKDLDLDGTCTDGESGDGVAESFDDSVEAFKRQLVERALERSSGNQARAARELGLEYHQLRYLLKKYGK